MTPEEIREALREVVDPELGVNIVDLGLVYGIAAQGGHARITMTMTTPACPLGEVLTAQVETAILQRVPGARSVAVDLVWDPVWDPSMMSATAKDRLGWA